jgi:hypothetical protein
MPTRHGTGCCRAYQYGYSPPILHRVNEAKAMEAIRFALHDVLFGQIGNHVT